MHAKLYEYLASTSMDAYFVLDIDGKILEVNDAATSMYGYSREELLTLSIHDIEAKGREEETRQHIENIFTNGFGRFESHHYHKTGNIIAVEVSSAFVPETKRFLSFYRDITELKKSQDALKYVSDCFNQALNGIQHVLYRLNVKKGCYDYISPAFEKITGYSIAEFRMNSIESLKGFFHPDDGQRVFAAIDDAIRTRTGDTLSLDFEYRLRKLDGDYCWLHDFTTACFDENGELECFFGSAHDITEHKRIVEQLKVSEESYRFFTGITSDYVHKCSRIGTAPFRIQWIGGAVSSITGYTQEEMLEKGCWLPIVHPDYRQEVAGYLFSLLPGDVKQIEFRLITKQGETRWVSEKTQCVAGEHPDELILFGAATDITEKRRAEENLRETQELFSLFMRHTPVYTFIKKIEGNQSRVIQLSDNFIDMLGKSADELRGRTMDDISPPDIARKITDDDIAVVNAGKVIQLDEEFNGRSYITIKFPILREDKDSLLAGYTIDITERKQADEAIKLNEERMQVLLKLNQMTDASLQELSDFVLEEAVRLTKSSIGYLAFTNEDESILTMHSWSKAAMAECSIIDKPIEYPIEKTGLWGEALRQRQPVVTNDYVDPNPLKKGYPEGHVQLRRHMNVPVFDGKHIVIVAGVGNKTAEYNQTDVQQLTLLMEGMWRLLERRRANGERLELERQLLHAQKLESLGVLAGGIAHDFNNILTAIVGNTELALMQLSVESPAKDNLLRVEKAAVRATDLAKQMLAYSGRGKFVIETIDINRLIAEMGRMLEVSISKKVTLRYNLTSNLPQIEVDATQIRQVLMNLVINASEAIGETDGVVAISTGSVQCDGKYLKEIWRMDQLKAGQYVFLEVADTGCGMSREVIDKLFDPFFTTKFTGRGLGMAAVMGIVRGHHGAIKVQSEERKGTTFQILLPASNAPGEGSLPEESKPDWHGEGTVLLVDDEETVRDICLQMLKNLGYEVVTAVNGLEAVDVMTARQDISLVILDLTMPHMDGLQCFKALHALKPEVKVVMSSGFNEQEVTKQLEHEGLAGFIQKPYKLADLKAVLSQI